MFSVLSSFNLKEAEVKVVEAAVVILLIIPILPIIMVQLTILLGLFLIL